MLKYRPAVLKERYFTIDQTRPDHGDHKCGSLHTWYTAWYWPGMQSDVYLIKYSFVSPAVVLWKQELNQHHTNKNYKELL